MYYQIGGDEPSLNSSNQMAKKRKNVRVQKSPVKKKILDSSSTATNVSFQNINFMGTNYGYSFSPKIKIRLFEILVQKLYKIYTF